MKPIVVFISLEAVTFLFAALLHTGIPILGLPEAVIIPATIAEGLIGCVLMYSAYAIWSSKTWAWKMAVVAHIFGIAGVLLGMTILAFGRGPQTELNYIYHRVILLVLISVFLFLLVPTVKTIIARWLTLSGAVGSLLFIAGTLIGGALRPEYMPIHQPISDLGIGIYSWVLNVPLILCGLSIAIFAVGFCRLLSQLKSIRSMSILLGLFGILFANAGVFPESDPKGPLTIAGFLHFFPAMFIGMPLLMIALFRIGSQLRKYTAWSGHGWYTTVSAILMVIIMPVMFVTFAPQSPVYTLGIGGLMERIFFSVFLIWFIITGWLLFRYRQLGEVS
jgi:hypothetical membrane protein